MLIVLFVICTQRLSSICFGLVNTLGGKASVVFILDYIFDAFVLCLNDVLFGFTNYRRELDTFFFFCNHIILLAKFYIHMCKVLKNKPSFCTFKKELESYTKTLSTSCNRKAVKTICAPNFI